MTYEVRCCCNPAKLLGEITLPTTPILGRIYVKHPTDGVVPLTVGLYCQTHLDANDIVTTSDTYKAIKSDERPLSWWQQLPSFITIDRTD